MVDEFNTPILFLIYKRPEITKRVFDEIRKVKPKHFYVSADGPRTDQPGEAEECELTRAVVSIIDWECEVHTCFLPKNLGLKKAVSSALDWFFNEVDEGIVLEYDCLPEPSFFIYCQVMLERYRNDRRIFSICGDNFLTDKIRGDGDYFYSRFTGIWGWATWKRTWKLWQPDLGNYDKFKELSIIELVLTEKKGQEFWLKTFDKIHSGKNNTSWAICLVYAQIQNGGYCVTPNTNLVTNIGFGAGATHTLDGEHPYVNIEAGSMTSFKAPTFFIPDLIADNELSVLATFTTSLSFYEQIKILIRRARNLIVRTFRIFFRNMN